jgi:hypothetical protein
MSQRYRNFLSWLEARRAQITQKDKDAHTRQISKHQGMQDAVQHYKDQLLAACTSQWLRNKQQLHGQVVQRAEQLALEAMDQLQDTLGSLLKLKGKLSVSTTVCGLGAVWSLFNALDKWEPTAARGNGRLSGKLPGTKGPDALVPETRDLTMKQMVEAAMDCGPVPRAAAQLVVWGGALGVSAVSTAASVSGVPTELGPTNSVGGAIGGARLYVPRPHRKWGQWVAGPVDSRQPGSKHLRASLHHSIHAESSADRTDG